MNILFGHYVADADRSWSRRPTGRCCRCRAGAACRTEAGIGMVHQHFALAESLTVLENIVLGTRPLAAPSLGLRDAWALVALMRDSGLVVPLDQPVERLAVGERQQVEILKVLYRGARILVLDEPTAVLTPQEVERLFDVLRHLRRSGLGRDLHFPQAAR